MSHINVDQMPIKMDFGSGRFSADRAIVATTDAGAGQAERHRIAL